MTQPIKELRQEFKDGTFVEVVAYEVQSSEKHPEGYKYRFQYGTTHGTILRYDNSHGEHDRHFGKSCEQIAFDGLQEHLSLFFGEVEQLREEEVITPKDANKDEHQERHRNKNRRGRDG